MPVTPVLGDRDSEIPRAHWTPSLTKMESFPFSEIPYLKTTNPHARSTHTQTSLRNLQYEPACISNVVYFKCPHLLACLSFSFPTVLGVCPRSLAEIKGPIVGALVGGGPSQQSALITFLIIFREHFRFTLT